MPKQYTPEVKSRAVAYMMDRLDRCMSVYAACAEMAPKLNVGKETLRRWVLQAQVDAGDRTGPSSEELAEIKALKSKIKDLEEANEILKQSEIFFARELDPRCHSLLSSSISNVNVATQSIRSARALVIRV